MYRLADSLSQFAIGTVRAQLRPDSIRLPSNALRSKNCAATKTPGAAVAVVLGDQVVFSHGYGVASVETGAPVTPDMLFRLGSTTKMFTASAVVELGARRKNRSERASQPLHLRAGSDHRQAHRESTCSATPRVCTMKRRCSGRTTKPALGTGIHAWKADFLFAPPGRIYSYSNPGYLAGRLSGRDGQREAVRGCDRRAHLCAARNDSAAHCGLPWR